MSQPRTNTIIPITPAVDHSGKEGYAVKIVSGEAAIVTNINDAPIGVIVEGADTDGKDSVALIGAGLSGTVLVKLGTSPGTVNLGTYLEIKSDGTFKADAGTSGTVCALALESGVAGELIEAALLTTAGTVTLEQSHHTTVESDYADPVLAVTGQVQDAAGNDLAGRFVVGVFFGEAANDGTPFDFGDLAAASGTVIVKEHTADAYAKVLTAADGSWGLNLTLAASDTVHSNAWVEGAVAVDNSGALVKA
jgi:hypothetical protein